MRASLFPIRFLFSCVLLLSSSTLLPIVANGDLMTTYQQALQNDSQFATAVAQQQATKTAEPLARAAFKPNISVGFSQQNQQTHLSGNNISSNSGSTTLSANQLLYDRSRWLAIKTSQGLSDIADLRLQSAQQALIIRTATRYFNVLNAIDEQRVARSNKAAILRQMNLAEERFSVGLNTASDVYDAQARYQQAHAEDIRTESQIETYLAQLVETLGSDPMALSSLKKEVPLLMPVPADIEEWKARATKRNLAVRIAAIEVANAKQQVAIARAQIRQPVVSLQASVNRLSDKTTSFACGGQTSCTNRSASVNLNIPLYSGGAGDARIVQAQANLRRSQQSLETAKRRAITQAITAYLTISNGISRVRALDKAVVAGESALLSKDSGFNAGLTTNIDVLNAQRDLSRSKTNRLRALYDYILAVLQLQSAVGDLDETDIEYVNQWVLPAS